MEKPILRGVNISDSSLLTRVLGDLGYSQGNYKDSASGFYDELYASNGLIYNIITALPMDATRHDVNIFVNESENKDVLTRLEKTLIISRSIDRQSYKDILFQALVYARLYGDGFIIVGYSDTKDLSKPVSKKGNLEIQWMTLRSRRELRIDISKRCYVLSITDNQKLPDTKSNHQLEIHPSRIIRFKGVELYEIALANNQYYNRSIIDLFYKDFCRLDATNSAVAKMISSHSAFSYGIKDLSLMIKKGQEDLVKNRFKLIMDSIAQIGGIAYDKENEEASYLNRNYSGLNDLINQMKDALLSSSGLPQYKLFNKANGAALSTSAEAERQDWADRVATYQYQNIDMQLVQIIKPTLPADSRLSIKFQSFFERNEDSAKTIDKSEDNAVDVGETSDN